MDTKMILDYLKNLEQNNNREWYASHKAEYQKAYEEFLKVTGALMEMLGKQEPEILNYQPKELTFKLVRDTRFSKDKSPYNPAFRVHISTKGKLPVPVGYFLMIRPGCSFLGGGLFADMFKLATELMRDYLVKHGEEWQQIIDAPEFKRYFKVMGTSLKNVPQGYDKEHPQAEFLKYKSWYLEYPIPDELFLDEEKFMEEARKVCEAMKPFQDFMNRALKTFEMPQR